MHFCLSAPFRPGKGTVDPGSRCVDMCVPGCVVSVWRCRQLNEQRIQPVDRFTTGAHCIRFVCLHKAQRQAWVDEWKQCMQHPHTGSKRSNTADAREDQRADPARTCTVNQKAVHTRRNIQQVKPQLRRKALEPKTQIPLPAGWRAPGPRRKIRFAQRYLPMTWPPSGKRPYCKRPSLSARPGAHL